MIWIEKMTGHDFSHCSRKKEHPNGFARESRLMAVLADFDENLRHYADQRITLDCDDGVTVNYGKFGDLLAEVKKVTGDKGE